VRVWDRSTEDEAAIEAEVEAFAPSLVHAFHAWRVGPLALRLARRMEIPLIVTLTGTDANHDLFDPDRAAVVRRVLEGAAAVVVGRHPNVRLLYAGPLIDAAEGDALLTALAPRPWTRYIGTVAHEAMASLLAEADVVLNCSISEGGMANSVLEALACKRAVLA